MCNFYSMKKVADTNTAPKRAICNRKRARNGTPKVCVCKWDGENGIKSTARRFDYKIIILHFLLHRVLTTVAKLIGNLNGLSRYRAPNWKRLHYIIARKKKVCNFTTKERQFYIWIMLKLWYWLCRCLAVGFLFSAFISRFSQLWLSTSSSSSSHCRKVFSSLFRLHFVPLEMKDQSSYFPSCNSTFISPDCGCYLCARSRLNFFHAYG